MVNLLFFKSNIESWLKVNFAFWQEQTRLCVSTEDILSYFKSVVPSDGQHDVC